MIMGGAGAAAGLNEAAKAVGGGMEAAAAGATNFTEKSASLLGVLSELSNTLDFVSRNPLLSFAFFERVGRSIQKDIIDNMRVLKNATEEEVVRWNKWGTAINITSSAMLSFATKVAYLQTQLRQASIENSRYFNSLTMPYGTSYDTSYQINRQQAIRSIDLNSEFAKAHTQVTQNLGRLFTPEGISRQLGMSKVIGHDQIQDAYQNYLERVTLYSRRFPQANIPSFAHQLYDKLSGYGLSNIGAIGGAISVARRAGEGGYIETEDAGSNENSLMQLFETYRERGMNPERAWEAAQMSLIGFGSIRGKGGGRLSKSDVMTLATTMPGIDDSKRIASQMLLNIRPKEMEGPEGQIKFTQALQSWAKKQGLEGATPSTIKALETSAIGQAMGQTFRKAVDLANLPDISVNIEKTKELILTLSKLNATELDILKKSLKGFPGEGDDFAARLREEERRARNIPSIAGGLVDWFTSTGVGVADDLGINPMDLQLLILGGLGVGGALKLRSTIKRMRMMGGKGVFSKFIGAGGGVPEISANILGEFAGEVSTTSASRTAGILNKVKAVKGPMLRNLKLGAGLVAGTALLSALSGRRGSEIGEDVGSMGLFAGATKFLGAGGAFFFDPSELGDGGPTSSERLNMELKDYIKGKEEGTFFTPHYEKDLEDRYIKQLKKEGKDVSGAGKDGKEDKESTLHVVFSTSSGDSIGEAMVEKGKEAFININLGAVLNSIG